MQDRNENMFRWTKQSIKWYESAALYGTFHRQIIEKLKNHLSTDEHLCEIACGTGFFTRALAPFVAHITANDTDRLALNYLANQLRRENQEKIAIIPGDWQKVLGNTTFDTVFFSFFSAFLNHWDSLQSLARKQIIAVLPSDQALPYSKVKEKETCEKVSLFLTKRGVSHQVMPLTLDFGQPFHDLQDAMEYFHYYYDMPIDSQLRTYLETKLQPTEHGFYFPKIKYLGILVAALS